MKTDIHPTYYDKAKITCACGNVVEAGSTAAEISTELCSACHPFYTGKQKLVDTAGKVDKFMARVKKAQEHKAKQVKKLKKDEEEIEETLEEAAKETVEEAKEKKETKPKKEKQEVAEEIDEKVEEKTEETLEEAANDDEEAEEIKEAA